MPSRARWPISCASIRRPAHSRAGWVGCAELLSALLIGLATAAAPLEQVSRPTRNRSLVEEAERLGAVAGELARRPDAEPLEQELYRALASIRLAEQTAGG